MTFRIDSSVQQRSLPDLGDFVRVEKGEWSMQHGYVTSRGLVRDVWWVWVRFPSGREVMIDEDWVQVVRRGDV